MPRQMTALLAIALLITFGLPAAQDQQPAPARLNLVVIEGNEAVNNIKQRTSRETIVQVEDENHRPVAGAAVAFLLPDSGPGGTFAGGVKSVSIVTDAQGRAVMPRMTANQVTGQYQIRVTASFRGQQASTTITQQNVAVPHPGAPLKAIAIIAGIAAAGGFAYLGYTLHDSGGTPTGTLTPNGVPTVGPPK